MGKKQEEKVDSESKEEVKNGTIDDMLLTSNS